MEKLIVLLLEHMSLLRRQMVFDIKVIWRFAIDIVNNMNDVLTCLIILVKFIYVI